MKNKKMVTIVCMLLAIILISSFAVVFINAGNKTESNDIILTEKKGEDVVSLQYEIDGVQQTFLKEDGTWVYESDRTMPMSQDSMNSLANAIANVKATRDLGSDQDLGNAGLTNPSNTIVASYADGSQDTFYLGSINTTAGSVYLSMKGNDHVYLVPKLLAERFSYGLYDIVAADAMPTTDKSKITGLSFETPENTIKFEYFDQQDFYYTSSFYWFLSDQSHEKLEGVSSKAIDTLLEAIVSMRYYQCIGYHLDAAKMEEYGLAEPAMKMSMEYINSAGEAKSYAFLFGKTTEEGYVYVKPAGSGLVYLMDQELLSTILDVSYDAYLAKNIDLISISTVEAMDIMVDGKKYNIELVRSGSDAENQDLIDNVKLNGKKISRLDFLNFHLEFTTIEEEAIAEDGYATGGTPYIEIVYYRSEKNHGNMTLKYIPYNDNFYRAEFNGKTNQLVNKRKVETVAKMLLDLIPQD